MKWFHKEDGGLVKAVWRSVSDPSHIYSMRCPICNRGWHSFGNNGEIRAVKEPDLVHFSDLSEDLQTAALAEML